MICCHSITFLFLPSAPCHLSVNLILSHCDRTVGLIWTLESYSKGRGFESTAVWMLYSRHVSEKRDATVCELWAWTSSLIFVICMRIRPYFLPSFFFSFFGNHQFKLHEHVPCAASENAVRLESTMKVSTVHHSPLILLRCPQLTASDITGIYRCRIYGVFSSPSFHSLSNCVWILEDTAYGFFKKNIKTAPGNWAGDSYKIHRVKYVATVY